MITWNKLNTAAKDGEAQWEKRELIDNLHPLQRVSGNMIESSQPEPIRGALLSEALQKPIHWHPVPCTSPVSIYIHARFDLLREKSEEGKKNKWGWNRSQPFAFCKS